MPKTATSFDLALTDPKPGAVLVQWLYDEIRSGIVEGRLKRGTRLPATRELAERCRLSRGTVVSAFEQLHCEGYLEGRVGAGTYVAAALPEDFLEAKARPSEAAPGRRPAVSRFAQRLPPLPKQGEDRPARAFHPLQPSLDAFPFEVWAQTLSRRMRRATRALFSNRDARGYRPLREAVADYLGRARGVRCTADEVIIVSGIQHGLDLSARVLLDHGDAVCVEDPCAPIVVAMFNAVPAKVVPVPVDEAGLDVGEGRRCCRRPKLVYVTPAHQFPLGMAMSAERRLSLLDWMRNSSGWIFEDDYNSEYRYSGRPIPALKSLDRNGSVILAGSFSKALLPTLRLGYLVVPPNLTETFAAARFMTDRHSSVIDQAVMYDFIVEGHFGRHIRRMRTLYAERLGLLRDAVKRELGGVLRIPKTEAGIHLVGWLSPGLRAEAVASAAAAQGVEVAPLNGFTLKARRPEGLLLGFAAFDAREIRSGVERLAAAIERCRPAPSARP